MIKKLTVLFLIINYFDSFGQNSSFDDNSPFNQRL